ncbi:NAD(P)H dehydrogenase [Halopseudomonas bauzanensis]|nr:NAD(P)H dehydrogenase [Halopseudomonas bauzanensis]
MKVLIVHAHPEPASYTSTLQRIACEHFRQRGDEVEISDLYAMNFNPVASTEDFTQRANPDYLVYALEQRHAFEQGALQTDIQREIDKIQRCDLLILSFPVYWYSMPAILKGWLDRVFISGLFYGGRRIFERGGMRGKRALVCATLGGREKMFSAEGIHDDLHDLFRPLLKGTLGYTGFDVLTPFFAYHVPYIDDAARQGIIEDWRQVLSEVEARETLPMPETTSYNANLESRISQ